MLLHNMSVPSRTEIQAEKRGIADRVVVFSLVYALTASGVLDIPELSGKPPKERELQDFAWKSSSILSAAMRVRWPSPWDLFAQIGNPKSFPMTADFLIGWRVGTMTEANPCYFCPDPQLACGVQARCSGDLYLARRKPDLRWERLLAPPIAFDEPGICALLL